MNLTIENLKAEVNGKIVLDNLNLNINKGEFHCLMGPNGTGKTTLSKVILGDTSYKIEKGDIKVDDKSILNLTTDERARLGIFLVFQNPTVIEGVKNSEFLREAINSNQNENISLYDFIKEVNKNSEKLELNKEMIHRSLNENFSGGEKKKNEILQINLLKPKLIILDELDSGLDVDSIKIVCKNINDYLKENKDTSVLMITHYDKIFKYVKPEYVHIISEGTIVASGDITLAKDVLENGYKKYSKCANKVCEE